VTTFFGIENVDGPAPRGMPVVPVRVNGDGVLEGIWPDTVEDGVAQTDIGGTTYSSAWFQYCGVQTYPGVDPNVDQDNTFRVANGADSTYSWMSDLSAGDPLTVEDFTDYENWGNGIGQSGLGKPALGSWRSVDVSPQETLVVQVLRSSRIQEMRENPPEGLDANFFRAATTEEGFIAWLNKCTHFCCVPGFKHIAGSESFGAEDRVYCQCHQSVYDPFSPVESSFVALPRPE
jgi:Rieske Fe-S protein